MVVPFTDPFSHALYHGGLEANVRIYDAERNIYTKYGRQYYNPKWGVYEEVPKKRR